MKRLAGQPRESGADALSVLLGLGQRARRAQTPAELGFVMVNETMALARYRQAFLWTASDGVVAASGVTRCERNTPFMIWLDRLMRGIAPSLDSARKVTQADFSGIAREQWCEWLPAHLLLLPMRTPDRQPSGILAFAREEAWSEAETLFLAEAAEAYGLAWAWHHWARPWPRLRARVGRIRGRWAILAVALMLAGALPVRLSVLAPGEVVAHDPAVVRAPIDGVIERVFVRPNQSLQAGTKLFAMDTTVTGGKMEVARKALLTANSEYEQAAQQAFSDAKAKAQLGVLAGHIGERQAEIAYYRDLLARSEVRAPRDGVAVMDDPADWTGRPVSVGEKVLAIADEQDVEIEGWLSPADLIELAPGAPVTLFPNADPLRPVRARLRYLAYESQVRPDGTMGHRLRASLEPGSARPRLGLKGTIRLDGGHVPLIYWLFRRPLALVRQSTGL
jgi:hypothetical protein